MDSCLDFLEGSRSGTRYDADVLQRLDPIDGAPLLARYDLTRAGRSLTAQALSTRDGLGMWRWSEILPVRSTRHRIHLGEGHTPLLGAFRLGPALGVDRLMVKAEGLNPTGSFKARGMSAAVSRARELGVRSLIAPSAGNAGGALATYGAAAGMPTTVVMPADTPDANIVEAQMAGAHVVLVEGVISDCGAVAGAIAARTGAFDVSTLKEPYRVEGKKTMGLELAEQLGWAVPDVVVYPTGGGTGLVGMWKAFDELEALGLIGSGRPRMVSVQAEGCAPIVHALAEGAETATPWPDPHTRASGLRVPSAVGDRLILQALRDSDGTAVAVPEAEIDSVQKLAGRRGVGYVSPESAAAFAAVASLATQGWLAASDRVVVFDTGIGQKYPPPSLPRPPVVRPDIVEDAEALELVLPGRIAPPTRPARPIAESSAEVAQPAPSAPSTPSAVVEAAAGEGDRPAVAERPATDPGEPADEERPSPGAGTAPDEEEVVRARTALPPVRRPAPPAPRLAGRSRVWAALDESASPGDPPAEDDAAEPADGVEPDLEAGREMAVAAGEEAPAEPGRTTAPSPAEGAEAPDAAPPAAGAPVEVEADAAGPTTPAAEREIEGPTAAASSPAGAVDPAVEAGASTPGQAAPSPTPDPAAQAEDDVAARAARAAEVSRPLTADPLRIDPWAPRVPGEMSGGGSAGSTAPTVPGAAPGQGRPSPPPPVPGAAPHPLSGPGPLRTPDPAPGPPPAPAPTGPPAASSPATSPTAPGSPPASVESAPPPGPTSAAAATPAPLRSPAAPPPDIGDTARLDQPAPPPVPTDAGPTAGGPAPTAGAAGLVASPGAPASAAAPAAAPSDVPSRPPVAAGDTAADAPAGPADPITPITSAAEVPGAVAPGVEAPAGAADQTSQDIPGAAPPSPPAATPAELVTDTGSTGYTAFRPLPAPPFREIVVGPLPAPPRSR